ncbi:MAG: oligosaccharide flippase family protein [Actinomycetaceae bacterium]|nr:oligosaccharide flippase family protein [Actinomycetaceae bacterium]
MKNRLRILDPGKIKLVKNTFFLYILVFSGYFFSLITVPYQTRVLGPELFGKIGWAVATMSYFALVLDFGYMLSATETIARHRDDKEKVEEIVGAVTINKMLFALGGLIIVAIMAFGWSKMNDDPWFYILCYLSTASGSFLLDFLYRGIEEMQVITIRSVVIRAFFTVCIFIFLREEADYWVIPALDLAGGILAIAFVYWHMIHKLKYRFVIPSRDVCLEVLKYSSSFFYSRIASTIYTSTNVFLLGFIYAPLSVPMGAYSSADKIFNLMKVGFGPIADSLYPYMVRNQDFKLLKKILIIFMPLTILVAAIIAWFAEPICILILGERFTATAPLLQLMMPIFVITLPIYLLGFPTLSPLGAAHAVNQSVIVASVVHVVMLVALFASGTLTVKTVIVATFITECVMLIYRIVAIFKYRHGKARA